MILRIMTMFQRHLMICVTKHSIIKEEIIINKSLPPNIILISNKGKNVTSRQCINEKVRTIASKMYVDISI